MAKSIGEDLDNLLIVSNEISANMNINRTNYGMEMMTAIEALPPEDKLATEKQMNAIVESMTLEQRTKYLEHWKIASEYTKVVSISFGEKMFGYPNICLAAKSLLKLLQQSKFIRLIKVHSNELNRNDPSTCLYLHNNQFMKIQTIFAPIWLSFHQNWWDKICIERQIRDNGVVEYHIGSDRLCGIIDENDSNFPDEAKYVKKIVPNDFKGKYQLMPSELDEVLGPRIQIDKLTLPSCVQIIHFMSEDNFCLYVCGNHSVIRSTIYQTMDSNSNFTI
jgi:hypothetical protein